MKRGLLGLCAASSLAAFPAVADAQVTWSEDFDSYPAGVSHVTCTAGVCSGPNNWTAWDNSDGANGGVITLDQALSAPQSLAITDVNDMVVQFAPGVYDDGVHKLSTWVYVTSAQTDNSYFIALNQYEGFVGGVKEWSLDLEFDGVTGKVRDFESGGEVDMVTDQWALVEVIINLNDDALGDNGTILYNGAAVASRSWSQGPPGTSTLQAIDLWGDSSTFITYFDDMTVETLPEVGACCVPDLAGSCLVDADLATCAAADGLFQGFGTVCSAIECPSLGPNGYAVDAPFTWSDDSSRPTYQDFPCSDNFGFGAQMQWVVTIPWPETWTFSLCGGATWDTKIGLGSTPCGFDLGFSDDDCPLGGVTTQSTISVPLSTGTYYLTLTGAAACPSDCGPFTITVDAPCALNAIPGALPENEADCSDNQSPDVYNSGCNDPAEAFLPISCGQSYACTTGRFVVDTPTCPSGDVDGDDVIGFSDLLLVLAGWGPCPMPCPPECAADLDLDCNIGFADLLLVLANWTDACPLEPASARDTDWWLFELTATTEITYAGTGTFPMQMLLISLPGADVTEGCLDENLDITAFALPGICQTGTITRTLDAGRYALWGGPQGGTDPTNAPCGSEYNLTFTCTP